MNRIKAKRSTTLTHQLIQVTLGLLICGDYSNSYTAVSPIQQHPRSIKPLLLIHRWYVQSSVNDDDTSLLQTNLPLLLTENEMIVASQFKIVTCSASSCTAFRKKQSLDEYATFTLFYERLYQNQLIDIIPIEETSCLGSCAMAPCVAIEHEDYDGTVALYGMKPSEFQLRAFHHVQDDNDVQRVWDILIESIRTMATTTTTTTTNESDENNTESDDVDDDDSMLHDHPNAV